MLYSVKFILNTFIGKQSRYIIIYNIYIINIVSIDISIKYLGIYIDENLKWSIHINHINNTIKKIFYIFKSLRYILNCKLKKLTYIALVQSIISYGISFWGGAYPTHLYNLEVPNDKIPSKIHLQYALLISNI